MYVYMIETLSVSFPNHSTKEPRPPTSRDLIWQFSSSVQGSGRSEDGEKTIAGVGKP